MFVIINWTQSERMGAVTLLRTSGIHERDLIGSSPGGGTWILSMIRVSNLVSLLTKSGIPGRVGKVSADRGG